jgi:mannose-6-phosphate isomerase-like protein (cupin superfamily)
MATAPDAHVLHNRHTGEQLALRRVRRDGEVWLELKGTLPPHSEGPPLHIHYRAVEEGTIIAGTLSAVSDGRQLQVAAGQSARFEAGTAHRWWNAGDEALAFEGYAKPVLDLDLYLQAVFEVINSGPPGRPSLFYMAHASWRHRHNQAVLIMPVWLQGVVLPIVVGLGTVLGRYRGTEWPGCPARCSPAPLATD